MKQVELVYLIGPLSEPVTGQSLATSYWADNTSLPVRTFNNNFQSFNSFTKVLFSSFLSFKIFVSVLFAPPSSVYVSLKRSLFGSAIDFLSIILCQSRGRVPVIIHLHGSDLMRCNENIVHRYIILGIWFFVTDIIILSSSMSEQVCWLPKRKVHIVTNFSISNISQRDLEFKALDSTNGPLRVLYLSNLIYSKGILILMDSVQELRDLGYDVILHIAGRPVGDQFMSSNQILSEVQSRLSESIKFLGSINGVKKALELDAAHILALPSFYSSEAQPISVIEGMAHGAVPLVSQRGYLDEVLVEGSSFMVDTVSIESVRDKLLECVNDRKSLNEKILNVGRFSRLNLTGETYVRKLDGILNSVLMDSK